MTLVNPLSYATESPAKTPIYIITEDNLQKTVFGDSISTKHHTWKSSTHHNQLIKRIIKFALYKPFCINRSQSHLDLTLLKIISKGYPYSSIVQYPRVRLLPNFSKSRPHYKFICCPLMDKFLILLSL